MGKYILFQKRTQYFWRLQAANGEPICHSEIYNSKQSAQHGIAACRQLSSDAENYTIFLGTDNQYYWNLKGKNGERVAQSEGYQSRQGAENGAVSCMMNGPNSPVEERVLEPA